VGAAETDRQIIQKVTILWRSGSTLSTRSGSNDLSLFGHGFSQQVKDFHRSRCSPEILDQCRNERDQAQILFLYLVNHDGLARYVVHEYLRRLMKQGPSALNFETDTVLRREDRDRGSTPKSR